VTGCCNLWTMKRTKEQSDFHLQVRSSSAFFHGFCVHPELEGESSFCWRRKFNKKAWNHLRNTSISFCIHLLEWCRAVLPHAALSSRSLFSWRHLNTANIKLPAAGKSPQWLCIMPSPFIYLHVWVQTTSLEIGFNSIHNYHTTVQDLHS
jgi:hypothetical protein